MGFFQCLSLFSRNKITSFEEEREDWEHESNFSFAFVKDLIKVFTYVYVLVCVSV